MVRSPWLRCRATGESNEDTGSRAVRVPAGSSTPAGHHNEPQHTNEQRRAGERLTFTSSLLNIYVLARLTAACSVTVRGELITMCAANLTVDTQGYKKEDIKTTQQWSNMYEKYRVYKHWLLAVADALKKSNVDIKLIKMAIVVMKCYLSWRRPDLSNQPVCWGVCYHFSSSVPQRLQPRFQLCWSCQLLHNGLGEEIMSLKAI